MSKIIVKSSKVPPPIGPYNQAVMTDNLVNHDLVYTSGQIALDPKTNEIILGDVSDQARLVLTNLKNILENVGSSLNYVVKATMFLKSMNDFAAVNKVYSEFFNSETAPARSTIEVVRLPKDALVEIEVVAMVPRI